MRPGTRLMRSCAIFCAAIALSALPIGNAQEAPASSSKRPEPASEHASAQERERAGATLWMPVQHEILVEAAREAGSSPDEILRTLLSHIERRSAPAQSANGDQQAPSPEEIRIQIQRLRAHVTHAGVGAPDGLDLDLLLHMSGLTVRAQHITLMQGAAGEPAGRNGASNELQRETTILRHLEEALLRRGGRAVATVPSGTTGSRLRPSGAVLPGELNIKGAGAGGQPASAATTRRRAAPGGAEQLKSVHDAGAGMQPGGARTANRRQTQSSSMCTSVMCSFAVDVVGVLRRTGGSACGDPGCGFLSFSGRSITAIAPGTFAGMSYLTVLDLSNNQLSNITHDDLKDLSALKNLVLGNNHITNIEPGTFAGLGMLEELTLQNNHLESIAPGTFMGLSSAVQSLILNQNPLRFISERGFEGLSGVRTLQISGNYMYGPSGLLGLQIEDGAFRHMPLLQSLTVSSSSLKNITNGTFSGGLVHLAFLTVSNNWDLDVAPGAFAGLPGLNHVDLTHNGMQQQAIEAGLFTNNRNITYLSLNGNGLTALSETILEGLAGSLLYLGVASNRITSISSSTFRGFSRLGSIALEYNSLTVLPLQVFNYSFSTGGSISLWGNPLVCRPMIPSYVSANMDWAAYSLPLCPDDETACTASKCSFEVDSAGVLRRTGGSACGDPGCGFLSFSGRSITAIAPGTFAGMSYLTVLDLSNNQLSNITHDDLKDLSALKNLVLGNNHITNIEPGTFAGLGMLEELTLQNNHLESIAPGTFMGLSLAVQSLILDQNRLHFISESGFEGLSGVRTLQIKSNYMYGPSGLQIEDGAFRHMPLLQSLTVSSSSLKNITNGTFSGGLVHLAFLTVSNNWDLDVAPGAFAGLPGLNHVDLTHNGMQQQAIEAGLFTNNRNITYLSLNGNGLTALSETILEGLAGSLLYLGVASNRITSISSSTFRGFSRLGSIALEYNSLTVLPLQVFNYSFSTGGSISLWGNPLVCRPMIPSYVSANMDWAAYSLPLCPSEAQGEVGLYPAECAERRTWKEIASQENSSTFFSGSLGMLATTSRETWGCFAFHPCLGALGASSNDYMCYMYDEYQGAWVVWGLNSEVQVVSSSCTV